MVSRTLPDQEGIGFLLNFSSRAVIGAMGDQLRPLGLDHDMWMMIQAIRRSPEQAASPADAAERLNNPLGSMIDAAGRLVRDGWAQAAPGQPARSGKLALTDKAAKALPGVDGEAQWIMEQATSGFTNDELETFADHLKRVIKNMA